MPGADLKELPNGTISVTWNNLSETDNDGNPYTFSVKEVDADGNDFTPANYNKTEDGLTVTNTYVIPKNGTATAYKVWSGGPSPRPTVWFKLYRQISGGTLEEVPVAEAPIKELADGTTSVTWNNLSETDNDGNPYTFSVKEVDAAGNDFTPPGYTKSEQGLTVTNAYIIPKDGTATAIKVWSGGPTPRPTVWFKLYRQISGGLLEEVPVAEAPIKELTDGTTTVTWNNLSKTDYDGNPYIFSVKEVDADGNDFVPENYEKTEAGLTVTNKYKIPTAGEAEATKIWVNGKAPRPTVWFKLYRQIAGGAVEEVPDAEIKELADGTTTVKWTGLAQTDINGNPYTFSVKEVDADGNDFVPENYEKTEAGLTVTNKYKIPTAGEAEATKIWVNGKAPRPTVWFKLYRQITGGAVEEVPDAEIKELADGTTTVKWTGLAQTDINGNPYTFSVKEVDADGNDFTPPGYTKSEQGLTVTNTYIIPKNGSATAIKVWSGGPTPRPTVWFKLYRQIPGGTLEEVPVAEAPIKELADGTTTVTWNNLSETDFNGNPYTFSVKEVDADGNDFTPPGYTKSEQGLTVTNTYVIPKDGSATAIKVWSGGPTPRPTVWFKLYRQIPGGTLEEVPVAEAPIKELADGTTSVTWNNLSETDFNGNPYTFSVKEVDADGNDFTPPGYTKSEQGLTVTNTYVIPKNGSATAIKVWSGGPTPRPTVWFKLYRQIPGGTLEEVPVAEAPIKELADGTTSVTWNNLSETDNNGNPYTFSVKEVDADGNDFVPENYEKTEAGLTVTNKYKIPTAGEADATKVWVNGSTPRPTVWFQLWRQIEGGTAVPVPDAEIKELADGTTTVKWTGLEETDINGNPYIFSVREVDADGNDFVPENYEKTEDGLTVTNTYIPPTIEALIANKIWMPEDLLDSLKVPVNFQLWRYTTDPATPEAVGTPVELNAAGGWKYTWTNMPATDAAGNPYTYFVTEPVTPDGFDKIEDGMTVTNTYVPPTIEVLIANKIWLPEDLLDSLKVPVNFQLWRYTTDPATPEAVGAPVELNAAGGWQYTWTNMPATDAAGNPYTYFVTEPVTPDGFEKIEDGMTVTNIYTASTDVVAAEKVWVGGASPRPTVYFQLWRTWEYRGTTYREPVPGAEIKALPHGTLTVIWTNIDTETLTGIPYTFSVKEVDAAGNDFTPPNYSKLEEGLKVTNTYVPPTMLDPLYINKIWEGGKAPYPAIYVQLYRNIPGETPEAVGSPVRLDGVADSGCVNECEIEPWRAIFRDLPLTDGDGKAYIYTLRETDADGNDYTPEGYVKSYDGNTIINKYISPKVDITATKVWKGGSGTRPTIRLQLYRNGAAFGSPVDLVHPNTTYTWKDLDKTDSYGQPYTYTVDEVTVPANYSKSVVGLTITNTYIEPPKQPKVPYTGDASNTMLYGMLALSSLLGFGAVTVAKRRKKN